MVELRFPRVERPLVSIVVVARNEIEWLPRALRACLDNTEPRYELIVVDNASTDGTEHFLLDVDGAQVIRSERNLGFGVANNLGASSAVGRYLFFLNSDALVHPGWLPPLLDTIERDGAVGAAGPRVLNLDGSLQLAGALLSRAGATALYGAGEDPDRPEFAFAREVDFLAGACLLVRRAAFTAAGGFDPAFGLIYFEDADLCLELWRLGFRVVYEPRSTVTHAGGGGREPSEAVLRLAERNRALFERRWRSVLASRPLAPLGRGSKVVAARDARSSGRLLVLGHAACAEGLARALPAARVTLAGAAEEIVDAPARTAVEHVADAARTLGERRFHYDAVVGDARAMARLDELLAESQPQAERIRTEELVDRRGRPLPRRLLEAAASAGLAPGLG